MESRVVSKNLVNSRTTILRRSNRRQHRRHCHCQRRRRYRWQQQHHPQDPMSRLLRASAPRRALPGPHPRQHRRPNRTRLSCHLQRPLASRAPVLPPQLQKVSHLQRALSLPPFLQAATGAQRLESCRSIFEYRRGQRHLEEYPCPWVVSCEVASHTKASARRVKVCLYHYACKFK